MAPLFNLTQGKTLKGITIGALSLSMIGASFTMPASFAAENSAQKIDTEKTLAKQIQGIAGQYQIAHSKNNNKVFVAGSDRTMGASTLARLDATSMKVEAVAGLPVTRSGTGYEAGYSSLAAFGITVDDVNNTVWVTNTRNDSVSVYDQNTLKLLWTNYTPGYEGTEAEIEHPRDVKIDHATGKAYVTGRYYISSIDLKTHEVKKLRIDPDASGRVSPMNMNIDGDKMYVPVRSSDTVKIIDLKSFSVEKEYKVHADVAGKEVRPSDSVVDHSTNELYVSSQGLDGANSGVTVYDLNTGEYKKSIPFGEQALAMVNDDERDLVYVTDFKTGKVGVIDTRSSQIIGEVQAGAKGANDITIGAEGEVYVANKDGYVAEATVPYAVDRATGDYTNSTQSVDSITKVKVSTTEGEAPKPDPKPTPAPETQTVTTDDGASLSGVKVAQVGQEIVVSGSGWKDKNGGGSVAAVKLDGGAVVPRGQVSYGGKEYGSRGVVAVVEADDAGNFVARIPFPSADNSNVKDSDWGVGSKHTVTFLSGSLKVDGGGKKVDVVRSAELEVTVGDTKAEPQQPKARPQTPQSDHQTQQPSKDNDQAQVQPQQPADENDTSNWVKLDAPATGQGSAGVMYVKPYTTGKGSKLRIKGSGWTNAEGKGGSTVALKLNYLKDGKPAQYSRAGGHGAIDQYLRDNGKSADSTTWALLIPDAGKANPAQGLYALNPDGTFDIEIDVPEQLQTGKTGDYLSITAQSGRNAPNDTQRAATSKTIPVNGQAAAEYKEPENTDVCSPEGGDFSPKLKIENPTVEPGGKLHITGSGWCNPDDKRVSKIGLKIDDGSVSHNDATKVNSNRTIWAIVEPDAKTGNIDTYIDLPTAENTGLSGEELAKVTSGEHTLRLLTGSLRKGDRHGTYGGPEGDGGVNTKFVIGDYKPGADPASVPASQLGEGDRHGVSVEHNGKQLTVKVPEAEPGTWVKVTPYLGDSAQLARASKWVQLDQNRTVSYTMSGELPAADYRIVVQSGNQGENGKVLGWAPLHVAEATESTPSGGGTSGRGSVSPADQSSYDSAEPDVTIDEDGQAWDSSGNAVSVSTAPAPYQNAGVGYVSSSIGTSPASIAPFTSGTRSVVVANAKSKAASARKATSANGKSKSTGPVKNAAKKTVQAKAANDNNGNDTASQGGSPQAKVEHRVNGTELTGFAKWFANNANNLLMSLAGIVLLALALTFKKKNSD